MAPRLSPFARTSDVLIPRQLAPTVGLAHGGVEFLEGDFQGIEKLVIGRIKEIRRQKDLFQLSVHQLKKKLDRRDVCSVQNRAGSPP